VRSTFAKTRCVYSTRAAPPKHIPPLPAIPSGAARNFRTSELSRRNTGKGKSEKIYYYQERVAGHLEYRRFAQDRPVRSNSSKPFLSAASSQTPVTGYRSAR